MTVWSNYPQAGPNIHFIRVGTLDDPSRVPPDIHIYTSTKQPWVVLPDGVPAVAEFYRPAEYWPAESRTRFKAAREAVGESCRLFSVCAGTTIVRLTFMIMNPFGRRK